MFGNVGIVNLSTLSFCLVFSPFHPLNSAAQKLSIPFFRNKAKNWRSYLKSNVLIDKTTSCILEKWQISLPPLLWIINITLISTFSNNSNYLFNRLIMTSFFHYQIWFNFTTDRREGVKSNSFGSEKSES